MGLQSGGPGVASAVAQPGQCGCVGVQHLVVGNGCDHHRRGEAFDQFALRLGRAGKGRLLLLDQAILIQLGQHVVEGRHQATDFVATGPVGAVRVVGSAAYLVRHPSQRLQGSGDLAGDQIHQAQDAAQ